MSQYSQCYFLRLARYCFICLCIIPTVAMAGHPSSFSKSKTILKQIYSDHKLTFYCGCTYHSQGKKLVPDHDSCGYSPRKSASRAQRIEWEHIMPAWAFGHQLECWQDSGRKGCKQNKQFKRMESDLHNLVPAIGEVNGDRSNFSFAPLKGEPRLYGRCDMEVDFKARKVEPSDSIRGDIARTYFYMRDQYQIKLSRKQVQLFTAWDKLDPVDEWELARNNLIKKIQGNGNPYVEGATPSQTTMLALDTKSKTLFSIVKSLLNLN
ncbi:endonuclease [Neptuniibacter sp. 2_MG-2023]|uniref:endonuclease n=1 Tax=Neptuniibacter sp. 2_MG-2023 TaxID=3062671 RepID=UPI0034C6321D